MNSISEHSLIVLFIAVIVFSTQWTEVICRRNLQVSTRGLADYDDESFDLGREVNIEHILNEIEAMGLRPKGMKIAPKTLNSRSDKNQDNNVEPMEDPLPTTTLRIPRREVFSIPTPNTGMNNSQEIILNDQTSNNLLDYSMDDENSNPALISNSSSTNGRLRRSMDDSVADILQSGKDKRQPRFFVNYDKRHAFNTSMEFTIPLFSFLMPGAGDLTHDGLDGNIFGWQTMTTYFLAGALSVAIYVVTAGSVDEEVPLETVLKPIFPGSQFLSDRSGISPALHSALERLVDAIEEANGKGKNEISKRRLSVTDWESFDYGSDVKIDDIIKEMEAMGVRSKSKQEIFKQGVSKNNKTISKINHNDCGKKSNTPASTSIQQGEKSSIFGSIKSFLASIVGMETSNAIDSSIQVDDGNSLDYALDIDQANTPSNSNWDNSEIFMHLNSTSYREESPMDGSVSDILQPVKGGRQPRLFYNFDRGSSWNTTVSYTFPIFSFFLPGYKEVRPDGVDNRSYGIVVWVFIIMMLTLLISVSTTMQGGLMQPPEQPIWLQPHLGRAFLGDKHPGDLSALSEAVHGALEKLADALEVKSCTHLATCEAYTDLHANSLLSLPFRAYTPLRDDVTDESVLTSLEVAARRSSGSGSCRREYPCIVDPFELMNLVIDWVAGKFSS
ncbi:uncharacterized protein LOC108667444 [Hyalella azteca]|uniref:Uncharacterized protein LOC108667444 n=1 Tax=Hyalella azteca TaxID=294128 RepID=A0A8B7N7Z0_HYAAZ|nr:uncharacterized protein LOC108667444 [Hyalella azteca]